MVEFVVRAQGRKGSGSDGVSEKDLGGRVDPCLRVRKLRPIRGYIPGKNIPISKFWGLMKVLAVWEGFFL